MAVECAKLPAGETTYVVCRVALRDESPRLSYADDARRSFSAASQRCASAPSARAGKLLFAMNAGMFHADFRPVGLAGGRGRELGPINRSSGTGNFFLQPNGVFLVDADGAARARDA